jgi:hypothetical protein
MWTLPLALVGAAWLLGTVLLAFQTRSVVVVAVLCALAALGPLVAWGRDLVSFSAGALLAAVGLAATCVWSLTADELRGPEDGLWEQTVAQAIAPEVDRCLGRIGERGWRRSTRALPDARAGQPHAVLPVLAGLRGRGVERPAPHRPG